MSNNKNDNEASDLNHGLSLMLARENYKCSGSIRNMKHV